MREGIICRYGERVVVQGITRLPAPFHALFYFILFQCTHGLFFSGTRFPNAGCQEIHLFFSSLRFSNQRGKFQPRSPRMAWFAKPVTYASRSIRRLRLA